jgi:hypothetical protein
LCEGRVLVAQTLFCSRKTYLQQAGAKRALAGDKCGAACRATVFGVGVGKLDALIRDAIDIRGAITHHPLIVSAEIPVTHVIAHNHQDVGFLLGQTAVSTTQQRCEGDYDA